MEFKRALVTGGAGFIGSHITDKLMDMGCEVAVVDNMRKGRLSNVEHHYSKSAFIFEKRGIETPEMHDVFRIFRPQVVFHLAAIPGVSYSVSEPVESNEANVHGTVNLLELSRKFGVQRFVFSSSSSVYGGSEILPTPESTVLNTKSPYALQKKFGEEYCKHYSDHFGLDTVSLRYFNVFGPRQYGDSPYSSVISSFMNHKRNGTKAEIHGDGRQFRDFCYVDNVVHANILAALYDEPLNGEVFNVGCGGRISVNELYKKIKPPGVEYGEERAGDVKCSCADISKIRGMLGYEVLVGFEEGLKKTEKWYMEL
jgi:UDP-glucose 4-epimerase